MPSGPRRREPPHQWSQPRAGRDFGSLDGADSEPVVVVNERLADLFWSGGNAVGRTLLVGDPENPRRASVVGIVEDVVHEGLDDRIQPQIYEPALQATARRFFVVARTPGDPAEIGVRMAMGAKGSSIRRRG